MNELIEPDTTEIVEAQTPNPMQLIAQATAAGANPDTMERLFALQERFEANEARKAYTVAMAAFKSEDIVIEKNKAVSHGNKHMFDHATLDHVCAVIRPHMTAQGLSWSWGTETLENGVVRVTCKITHVLGHREETSLEAENDKSGAKNAIQALGSAVTYLQRYTLLAALGLATGGQDTDGIAPADNSPITDEQAAYMDEALTESGTDKIKFCKAYKIGSISEMPAAKFERAMQRIKDKGSS